MIKRAAGVELRMTLIHSTKTPEQEASFEFWTPQVKKIDIKTHHNPKNNNNNNLKVIKASP